MPAQPLTPARLRAIRANYERLLKAGRENVTVRDLLHEVERPRRVVRYRGVLPVAEIRRLVTRAVVRELAFQRPTTEPLPRDHKVEVRITVVEKKP